ncbi:hypothetical protein D9619_010665 [Psilocybe cf. subviscida]|uniref:Hydroxymethylglutaryl-CoA reductase (NADPH) n=1 Tax=Psilocybe cf. subviscida TaxID=2480587 RepID=A0A8H5B818_9AGAR|nr:hypothetical protein D9619_010665 [Psilocybe cf. subviscida]
MIIHGDGAGHRYRLHSLSPSKDNPAPAQREQRPRPPHYVTVPSIEVGTVSASTVLAPQGGVLGLLGIKRAHPTHLGLNAQQLAHIVASAVMAGELSLMSALVMGDLTRAHMTHNRNVVNTPAVGVAPAGEGHDVLVDSAASSQ